MQILIFTLKYLDFRASLLYKESFIYLPTCISLIENNIAYFKERLSPKTKHWDYLPKGILPRLLSYVNQYVYLFIKN